MLLEQFIAVADYTKQKNNECSLRAGQSVEVIDKNENGQLVGSAVTLNTYIHVYTVYTCV